MSQMNKWFVVNTMRKTLKRVHKGKNYIKNNPYQQI